MVDSGLIEQNLILRGIQKHGPVQQRRPRRKSQIIKGRLHGHGYWEQLLGEGAILAQKRHAHISAGRWGAIS